MYERTQYEKNQRKKRNIIIGTVIGVLIIIAAVYFTWSCLFSFETRDLIIESQPVTAGNPLTISTQIENNGAWDRDYTAELKINNVVIDKKTVNIAAKKTAEVSFPYTPDNVGTYEASIGQSKATFIVSEGILPAWYSGDKWTYQGDIGTYKYQIIYEVMGSTLYRNHEIYLLRLTGATPAGPLDRGNSFVDTTTLSSIEEERISKIDNQSIYQKTDTEYEIINGIRWPLKLGDTWTERQTKNILTKNGFTLSQLRTIEVHTFTVESIEDVTVPLGVFRCFKIVERDDRGAVVGKSWYSDRVKRDARYEVFIDGIPYSFDLVDCKIAATPPKTVPSIEIQDFTEYYNEDGGYILYYQKGWELLISEEDSSLNIFTTEGANGINFASLRIRVIDTPETEVLDLDMVYEDIIAQTTANDPDFVLTDSTKTEAESSWHNLTWESKIGDVNTTGRTILIARDHQLFIITGWVQESYQQIYMPQFEQLINSIGILTTESLSRLK